MSHKHDDLFGWNVRSVSVDDIADTFWTPDAAAEETSELPAPLGFDLPLPTRAGLAAHEGQGADSPAVVTVADGGKAAIAGPGTAAVVFAGESGALTIADSQAFRGEVSGLAGSDTIDLADLAFNANTQATFVGTASGGTLTVSDGTATAEIALKGDYLSSTWSVSDDGNGGVNVVDPVVSTDWQMMKVGAGGWAVGLDEAPDGTLVVRTDTNGAYLWTGSSWTQLVTATSMPAAFIAANPVSSGQGVYEIQIAPSNSSVLYMLFNGEVFTSANKGASWTQTAFTQVVADPNTSTRMYGQKMAIDPVNPNICYVGTPQNGLLVTKDGGKTWAQVSAIPVSDALNGEYPGITGVMFDPGAGGSAGGATQTIFASSYGNGVYESANGGSSWAHLSGGPSNVEYATVGANGAYYAIGDGNADLWRYYNGAWSELIAGNQGQGIQAIAINPNNQNEIVAVSPGGYLNVSYNAGKTWSTIDWSFAVKSTDIPWEAAAQTAAGGSSLYLSVGGAAFSATTPNELVLSTGTGAFNVTVPTSSLTGQMVYNDMSAGIENLVANEILVAPGGTPVLASWDRPFIKITDLNNYPTTYGPVASNAIVAGWSVDYASSTPSFLVGIADWWGVEESGYSTDGGATWNKFVTEIPGAGSSYIGGDIAASTTQNFIWAPADGNTPYYTLNGGLTWNAITLPGVSSWSNFDWAYYLTGRTVTADRVLANTFYIYDPDVGVFETQNGGQTWALKHSGAIAPNDDFNNEIMSVPGQAGNLFWTAGIQGDGTKPPANSGFYFSSDQGKTWAAVPNVLDVLCFGFGAAAPGQTYPSVYIVGYVNKVYGVWQSTNQGQSWTQIGTQPAGELDQITTISGDPNKFGEVYVGFGNGGGYAYLTAGPLVTTVTTNPGSGIEIPGDTVTFTVAMSEAVTVSGGAPTLNLNDGGVATYVSGSGSSDLIFSYTVASSDATVNTLAISSVSLNGATVKDASGTDASLSGAVMSFPNLAIDPPYITALTQTPAKADLGVGKTVTFAITLSDPVTIAKGTPALTLNDGGTATYVSGSGTNTLKFSYTVGAADSNVSALSVTAVSLAGATLKNASGAAANLSLVGVKQKGPQIDTITPAITSISESPSTGTLGIGKTVTFTLNLSDVVTVSGAPTLTLNDGGVATYQSGSGSNTLIFSYTVAAGQSTPSLAATAMNLNGATIANGAGTAASLGLTGLTQAGPAISPPAAPVIVSIADGPASGNVGVGGQVTLSVVFSSPVVVSGGHPVLTLNTGGTAVYVSGSGTSTLKFVYTVSASQQATSLAVTGVQTNGAVAASLSGVAANLSATGVAQSGPAIWPGLWSAGGNIAAANATVYIPGGVWANVTGVSDVVHTTSSGGSLSFSTGTSAYDGFYGNGAAITLQGQSRLRVYGSKNSVSISDHATVSINGNGNWVGAGGDDRIYLSSGVGNMVSGSHDTLFVAQGVGAIIMGSADSVTSAANATLNFVNGAGYAISASDDKLTFNPGVSATVTGSGDAIDATSGGITLLVGGNGASGAVDAISGYSDHLSLMANSNVSVQGQNNTITLASGDTLSLAGSTNTKLTLGSLGGGTATVSNFAPGYGDIIDLLGGVGGYRSAASAAHAVTSDGAGGALLSLGTGGTLHLTGTSPSALSAANFQIG